jgi:PAS domain S-box-containing protein
MATERLISHPELNTPMPESNWLLQTVVESLNDGIIITDVADRILHVNSRLAKLIGCKIDEMIGHRPSSSCL